MPSPRCIASAATGSSGRDIDDSDGSASFTASKNNFFKEAQWSPDGTCLITKLADNGIRTFVVPPDLLVEEKQPHALTPYSVIESSEPVKAYAGYPGYDLADPSTTFVLSSQRDHPTRLSNALDGSKVASYPLVNPVTETFISPYSLLFSRGGSHFVAGSENLISVFDASRVGQRPVSYLPTSPKRGGGVMGMKGIVSALAIDNSTGILATGTFSRHVGLYSNSGEGECVGVFCVEGTDADKHIGGAGITQVDWSQDGRYMYITERKSNGVMFYDIRKTGQLLGWLTGRNARTNQRLNVDFVASQDRTIVYAGGVDGYVRQWLKPHECEGSVNFSVEWLGHESAVASIANHKSGSVLATCSGQRQVEDGLFDSTLKIWSLAQEKMEM